MVSMQGVFGFHAIPVSTVLIIAYLTVWLSVYITDQLPPFPTEPTNHVNTTQAYHDLQRITFRPHPYNSHANEQVREYLLDIISKRHPTVEVISDTNSTGKWVASSVVGFPAAASYFEGNNILVRIPGTADQNTPGVLFSAHWDSVSTAKGATDDGIGVATLLQLISYFDKHPPKRTVVFNINNGEEDGLHGAHALLLHPWASQVGDFVNLEGAAAGGPVLPFRATGSEMMRAYQKGTGRFHANVLSADTFQTGAIRSATDYQVYVANGMRGIDFAFYRGRSRYHTQYDSIPWNEGRERALWSMIDAAFGTGVTLASLVVESKPPAERRGVWFDLFGSALLLFSLDSLFTFNVVALVVGPILLLLLLALQIVVSRKRTESGRWPVFGSSPMVTALWNSARYWIAIAVVMGVQAAWVIGWVKLNPFTAHTYPYTVLLSSFTLSSLVFIFIVNLPLPSRFGGRHLSPSPLPLLLHTYLLTYVLLILSTVGISKAQIGGSYFITVWNVLVWAGCVIGVIFGKGGLVFSGRQKFVVHVSDVDDSRENADGESHMETEINEAEEANATERTPLLSGSNSGPKSIGDNSQAHATETNTTYIWLPILIVVVPFPLILLSQIGIILVGALPETLADGSKASGVYILFAIFAGIAGLLSWPFVVCGSTGDKQSWMDGPHRFLITLLVAMFVITTLPAWLAGGFFLNNSDRGVARWTESHALYPPFSPEVPLKVAFQQTVEISPDTLKVETALTGAPDFLEKWIVPRIPSATTSNNVSCSTRGVDPRKIGLTRCVWPSGKELIPIPVEGVDNDVVKKVNKPKEKWDWNSARNPWFKSHGRLESFNLSSSPSAVLGARISVTGTNTRNCRVYFDQPLTGYRVNNGSWENQEGYEVPESGINEVRLWTREWGKEIVLDVIWKEQRIEKRTGRVACEWAEYESGMVGINQKNKSQIPAFEEILAYLPRWATVTKLSDGLVEVWEAYEL